MKMRRPTEFDEFTQQYIRTALWSSSDGDDYRSLGAGEHNSTKQNCRFMTVDDISDETLSQMVVDCAKFQTKNANDLAQNGDASLGGHRFWLSRNGHGVQFADDGWDEDTADRLDTSARMYGEMCLYVGDDGKIYS
jgi:hypothetical protein